MGLPLCLATPRSERRRLRRRAARSPFPDCLRSFIGRLLDMVILLLICALPLLAAAYLLKWRPRVRRLQKLTARVPGPPTWPLIGNALQFGFNRVELVQHLLRLVQEYGSFFRIWVGPELFLVLLNPDDIKVLLSNSKAIEKAVIYSYFYPWLGKGLLTSTGEKWFKHRKLITPAFHFKILKEFLVVINGNCIKLIKKLKEEVDGSSFDICKYANLYSLDVITETAMGSNVNAQEKEASPYVHAVKTETEVITLRCTKPWLYFNFTFNRSSLGKNHREALQILHGTTKTVIQKKKDELLTNRNLEDEKHDEETTSTGKRKHLAFLDLLLEENLKSGSFSDKNLQEEVDTFMFAGHDTTASAIAFTLWLLSTHQNIQDKVYKEIETLLSTTSDDTSFEVLNKMKYLECVIKESMRLYPSVPLIARQIKEDITITGDRILPANSNIVIPIFVLHRNPTIFPQPEAFIPERFLNESKCAVHPFAYIPFSAGFRNCIGQKFAMLLLKATISKILCQYKILPDHDFKPVLCTDATMKTANGIKFKITSRMS